MITKNLNIKIRLILVSVIYACLTTYNLSSQTLDKSLQIKDDKKGELQTVLNHYKKTGESEKHKAALFLFKNISIHQSTNYIWKDLDGNTVSFSEMEYPDYNEALKVIKKIKDSIKVIPKQYVEKDVSVVTSKFLIKNIDLAFKEWKNNPWSSSYSFQTFCEYILPYRSLIEPLEDWRQDYKFIAAPAINNVEDKRDPVEVCSFIIQELKDFSFTSKRIDPIPLLSPQQLLFRRQGTCPDLANLVLLACRSLGLAVTFDFTPHHAASSNRHFWNTIINTEGEHIPFNGNSVSNGEGLPYVYDTNTKRLGKVYRKTYSIQETALRTIEIKSNIPNGFLQEKKHFRCYRRVCSCRNNKI